MRMLPGRPRGSPPSAINKSLTIAADSKGVYLPDFRFKRVRYVNLSDAPVTIAGVTVAFQQINTIAGSGLNSPYDNTAATSAEMSAVGPRTITPALYCFTACNSSTSTRMFSL